MKLVTRDNMRFVPNKTPEQQSGLVLQCTRHRFIRIQPSAGLSVASSQSCERAAPICRTPSTLLRT